MIIVMFTWMVAAAISQIIVLLSFRFYNSLPPVSKAYGTMCLVATTAFHLGLYPPVHTALIYEFVFKHFQV